MRKLNAREEVLKQELKGIVVCVCEDLRDQVMELVETYAKDGFEYDALQDTATSLVEFEISDIHSADHILVGALQEIFAVDYKIYKEMTEE